MSNRALAEAFPPGDFLKEELEARNWTQADLAEILGRNARVVSEVISGKRAITPETATGLANAFGTSAQYWMNLESAWQLSKLKQPEGELIVRKSKLYERFPVKEMIRRGWIEATNSIDVLESRFFDFFGVASIEEDFSSAYAFRKSDSSERPSALQVAWVCQAKRIAEKMVVPQFSSNAMGECFSELKKLLGEAEEIRHVPKVLANYGIRFVVVEQIAGSKVDGVCFWIKKQQAPVVAMSLRFDRIDWFWFTLIHELRHVANGDGKNGFVLDVDLVGDDADRNAVPESEKRADAEAADFLLESKELENFIARVKPLYSEERIKGFAARVGVHPGIVVGRLQNRREIPFSNLRKALVKVRDQIVPASVSDGWGSAASFLS